MSSKTSNENTVMNISLNWLFFFSRKLLSKDFVLSTKQKIFRTKKEKMNGNARSYDESR